MIRRAKKYEPASGRGFSLLAVMLWTALLLSFLAGAGEIYLAAKRTSQSRLAAARAFYLAEAGLAYGRWRLESESSFYTDPAYSGPAAGRKSWLVNGPSAGGSIGLTRSLAGGGCKLVMERGVRIIYAIGFADPALETSPGICLLKLAYQWDTSVSPPVCRPTSWSRLY